MRKDLIRIPPLSSSFLSCEKDIETILRKLFVESQPYSEDLKRLLIINSKDCLENKTNPVYEKHIQEMSVQKLCEEGYVIISPRRDFGEFAEVKNIIWIDFDDFAPSVNPKFRNCTVNFNIICHVDYWNLGNYRTRPTKIIGIIDGILNNTKLSGIGTLNFLGCKSTVYNQDLAGYSLIYMATHGSDDSIASKEESDS